MNRIWAISLGLLIGSATVHGQPLRKPRQPDSPATGPLPALPDGAIVRLGSARFNHGGQITTCAFSADGSMLLTGGNDSFVRVWDVATGQEKRSWRMNSNYNQITAIRLSPDGKMVAVASAEGLIRVWDADGTNELFTRQPPQQYDPAVFCWVPGTRQLAVAGRNGNVRVIEVPTGREIRNWANGVIINPQVIVCSPDAKQLAATSFNGQLKSYDLNAGKEGVVYENPQNGGNYYRPGNALAFTPDGKFLVGTGSDRAIYLWHSNTGKIARRVESTQSYIYSMAISPNGRFIAVNGSDARVRIIGLASGSELRVFEATRNGSANVMDYSPDGRYLATVLNGTSIRIWDVAGGKELHDDAGHRGAVSAAVFLGDGRVITAGQDQTLRCWDPKTGKEVDRLGQQPSYMAQLVPDATGQSVFFGSNNMNVLKWKPGSADMESVALSAQGGAVLLAADAKSAVIQFNQTLTAFSLPDGKQLRQVTAPPNSYPQSVVLSPGQRYLAYVDNNMYGTLHIWDLATGHQRRTISGDQSMSLYAERMLFSPDGRLLVSVASHRAVLVYEVFTGLLRAAIPRPDNAGMTTAAFSPNGRLLAVGSQTGEVRLIDMRTGATVGPFVGHRGPMTSLAFSSDGSRLVSANQDTTAVVWDVKALAAKLPQQGSAPMPAGQQLEGWWASLASSDGRAASEAVWSLLDRPQESLALFKEKLKPVLGPDPATVSKWVTELDYPKFQVREKATRNLAALGESARDPLEVGMKQAATTEARFRLRKLLETINSTVAPGKLQPLRALEVLEKVGGDDARHQLETLASQSTDQEIRQEIERVLKRWQ